ncbi:MAG: asparagine synthase-related protein [Pseudolabrys sp.]
MWDGRLKKLLLARDPMGPRPIFYSLQPGFLAFATEIKALWTVPDVPRVIPDVAVGYRLMAYPERPPGGTIFEGILGLPGAAVMTVTAGGAVASRRYWLPHADPAHEGRDEAYYVATYRALLAEAVACCLRRTLQPAALLLSGGYDSTAIAGLAGPILAPQGRKLIALSAVLPEDYKGPLRDVRRWVEMCRRAMPHLDVRYFVRQDETILTDLERFFACGDRPASLVHHVRAGLYNMAVAAGARVVMDGVGSDYTISPRAPGALARMLRKGRLGQFIREARARSRVTGRPLWRILGSVFKSLISRAADACDAQHSPRRRTAMGGGGAGA